MKKTAVEWLVEQISYTTTRSEIISYHKDISKLVEQAKEMEKQQIGKAFLNGRIKEIGQGVLFDLQPLIETFNEYYNEIYKNTKQ